MSKICLVTGGARSGKSRYAEKHIQDLGMSIAYLATGVPFDDGMRDRIKKHRSDRPAQWTTYEYATQLHLALDALKKHDAVLVDCITVMLNNYLFELDVDWDHISHDEMDRLEAHVMADVSLFVEGLRHHNLSAILVTNEVGQGIVPENRLARLYRDMAGRVNQQLGQLADEVILVVCGQSLKIK